MASKHPKATMETFLVRRDAEGRVAPLEVPVTGVGAAPVMIKILPTTIGSLKGISRPEEDCVKWPLDDKIRYVREHVVEPNFGELTPLQVEESLTLWDLDMLLIAAIQHGGPGRKRAAGPTKGSGRSKKRSR